MREISFIGTEYVVNIEEVSLLTYVIENKKQLYNIEQYLRNDFEGQIDYLFLRIDKNLVELDENIEVITDLFTLDPNTKKNINSLYKILANLYSENLKPNLEELVKKANKIINEISMDFDLEIVGSNSIEAIGLFKMIDLHFSDEDIDAVKRMIKYIQTINELRKINIFITFRLHEYFDCEEIRVIVKELSYRNIKIINVESTNVFNYLEKERVVIQDNDLCIIE